MRIVRVLTVAGLLVLTVLALPAGAADHSVHLTGNQFQPKDIQIAQRDRVVWTNDSTTTTHTVTAENGSFDSTLAPGTTFTQTFDQAGTVRYYCRIHGAPGGAGMSGSVVVQAPPTTILPPPATTAPPPTTTTARPTTTTARPTTTTPSTTTSTSTTSTSTTTSTTSTTSTTVAPTTTTEPTSSGGSSNTGLLVLILLAALAVAGAGGYALWRYWPNRQGPPDEDFDGPAEPPGPPAI